MTTFDFLTQDPDTLAAWAYGLMDETENLILDKIYLLTGITIDSVNLAPEIRIESIKQDLLRPYTQSEVDDADTT